MDFDFLARALSRLKTIHIAMRDTVRNHIKKHDITQMSRISRVTNSDYIYDIDNSCEKIILEACKI